MKKLFLVLVLLLSLFGCGNQNQELNYVDIEGYAVDMSGYNGVSSTGHNFVGITPDELIKVIDEGGSAIVFMGYTGCHVCQEVARYINEVAQELDVTVYYLNCTSEQYPLRDAAYDNVVESLNDILRTNESGDKTIYTPHVFSIINGVPQSGHISVVNSWQEGNPSEESIQELENIYREIMQPFAK